MFLGHGSESGPLTAIAGLRQDRAAILKVRKDVVEILHDLCKLGLDITRMQAVPGRGSDRVQMLARRRDAFGFERWHINHVDPAAAADTDRGIIHQ